MKYLQQQMHVVDVNRIEVILIIRRGLIITRDSPAKKLTNQSTNFKNLDRPDPVRFGTTRRRNALLPSVYSVKAHSHTARQPMCCPSSSTSMAVMLHQRTLPHHV